MKSLSTIASLPDASPPPVGALTINNSSLASTNTNGVTTIGNSSITTPWNTTPTFGSLDVNGTVKLNGEDLEDRLKRIETLLHIPTRDVKMESQHPKLKKLFEEYEKELAKYRTWYKIKDSK